MKKTSGLMACCLIVSSGALTWAQHAGAPPIPPQLQEVSFGQGLARINQQGRVAVHYIVMKSVWVQKQEAYQFEVKVPQITIDPATQEEKTIYRQETRTATRTVDVSLTVPEKRTAVVAPSDPVFSELDGQPADVASLAERLKEPTLIVVSHGDKPVPSEFAVLFRPGTLVARLGLVPQPMPQAPPPPPSLPGSPAPQPVSVPAQDAAEEDAGLKLPVGPPPTFRLARINENGYFALRNVVQEDHPVTGFVQIVKTVRDGDTERQVSVCVPRTMHRRLNAALTIFVSEKDMSGATVEGKPMESRHVNALKQREIPVIVALDGQSVDPRWLENLKPQMLILIPPTTQPPQPQPTQHRPHPAQPAVPSAPGAPSA